MNSIEMEIESVYRRRALFNEAHTERQLMEPKGRPFRFPMRVLPFVAAIIIALGTRILGWFGSAGAQGYMPNLHID